MTLVVKAEQGDIAIYFFFFQWICTTVAVLLHYLYTASFTWMCAEGLHLYFKIVTAFNLHRIKMIYYVILGWGKYYKNQDVCIEPSSL